MGMERYRIAVQPLCAQESVVQGECFRISVLTSRLLRLEYAPDGVFEDRATQTVLCRAFPRVEFRAQRTGGGVELYTEHLHLSYDGKPFSPSGLRITMTGGGANAPWRYGDEPHAFGGTARTLDGADGAIPLEPGLFSHEGYSVLDDSRSMALTDDGWVTPRGEGRSDLYFFAYGRDFEGGLRDFYRLCGPQPLLPRYALGGWWSRYHRYSEAEYMELIERFQREELPFTVAVVDMDWHLVDIDPAIGSGWTGYTWNRELFPDPERFARRLHDAGMHVTLNVHPADGIRAHEDCYPAAARAMGIDPETRAAVDFDAADPKFLQTYFDVVHHPLEDGGVDFWWIDWQQGTKTAIPGLDPLWILNHYHYLDSARHGRPLTFTRYAGPGSHRYPVGFSGDTYITWDSLRFQPYFTSAASDIGFGWWSHDIGGHMGGGRDDELAARWVQFGAFSPIFRLHSMSNPFTGKEPWNFGRDARAAMEKYIRLRHAMIPYLYTMNRDAHALGRPLIRPLYWLDPGNYALYTEHLRNPYLFGTQLLVAPVTEPADRTAAVAKTKCCLPDGLWFDVFTGVAYRGGRMLDFYRPIDDIPVLARAGAIVPLQARGESWNDVSNPRALEVRVYPGADGAFTLWEDADQPEDDPGNWASTQLALRWDGDGEAAFVLGAAQGNLSVIPRERTWTLRFCCVEDVPVQVQGAGAACAYCAGDQTLTVTLEALPVGQSVTVTFPQGLRRAANPVAARARELLMRAQTPYFEKALLMEQIERDGVRAAGAVMAMAQNEALRGALLELLTADF